jgi:hypothetical protein
MKIKITTVQEYDYDIEKEISRLREVFKGSVLKRQLTLLNAFLAQDLDKVEHLYHMLPYNKKEECPEQEFVGLWISILWGEWPHSKFLKHEKKLVEIVENL